MEKGDSRSIRYIKNFLGNEKCEELDIYVNEIIEREFLEVTHENLNSFKEYISDFLSKLSEEELLEIKSYTGYNYKNINAILRNNWNYEVNGKLDDNTRNDFLKRSENIRSVINKFPNIPMNFKTYRGVSLDSFKKYGIESIEDFVYMKDKLMYEDAFTSTSIIKENSYFKRNLENVNYCNVLIEYYIPEESKDGALLTNEFLSYSSGQTEYLLNSGCLSKIFDVSISEDKKTAILKAAVIPKSLYDKYTYTNDSELKK